MYELTRLAERDLIDIWRYTKSTWGEVQADKYLRQLETCCEKIAEGKVSVKEIKINNSFVLSHHCEHHYVFCLAGQSKTVVIGFLHERMDLARRLKGRI